MKWVPLCVFVVGVCGCSFLADPEGDRHDRVLFETPEQVVLFLYQNLSAGRHESVQQVYLSYRDQRSWMVYDQDHPHPWSREDSATAEVIRSEAQPDGDVLVTVRERWSGGERDRWFRFHETSDGWRIHSNEGQPGDGLLR